MIVTEKIGITDKEHLIETITKKSSIKTTPQMVREIVDRFLEHAVEVYKDEHLAGYMLVFNFLGVRSFHGYKLVEGYGVRALRLAKGLIEKFNIRESATTIDQAETRRALSILGFTVKNRYGAFLSFGRG